MQLIFIFFISMLFVTVAPGVPHFAKWPSGKKGWEQGTSALHESEIDNILTTIPAL